MGRPNVVLELSVAERDQLGSIAPKYVYLKTPRGDLVRTNEVVKDENGDLIMVDCCDGVNLKAIEWELARLDPETYTAKKPDLRMNNQSNVNARVSLVNVLNEIAVLRSPRQASYRKAQLSDGME